MELSASSFRKNDSYSLLSKGTKFKETGSPFDATSIDAAARPGSHALADDSTLGSVGSTTHIVTKRHEPTEFLRKHSGLGGSTVLGMPAGPRVAEPEHAPKKREKASTKRSNPPNTDFRRYYERGDLPICVEHTSRGIRVGWKAEITKLDFHHYLPIFFDGLREIEEPYQSLALHGTEDLLQHGGDKVLPVVPQIILPIRNALITRDEKVVRRVLLVLQELVKCAPMVGEALVPYYRQILPVLNIFRTKKENVGDAIVYGQRKRECLSDLVEETLEEMELHGGESAFINIRYMVPTYTSVVFS